MRLILWTVRMESGRLVRTENGTPQGGNLRLMLANIFLHYVLDLWFEKRAKTQILGQCYLVRSVMSIRQIWQKSS